MRYWITMYEKSTHMQFRMTEYYSSEEKANSHLDSLLKKIGPAGFEAKVFSDMGEIPVERVHSAIRTYSQPRKKLLPKVVEDDIAPKWAMTLMQTGKRK